MADEKYIKLSDAKDVFYYTLADGDCAIADYREAYELLESVEAADVRPVVRDTPHIQDAIDMVIAERRRQIKLWGDSGNTLDEWIRILGEEFGELCQAVNETCFQHPRHPERGGYANIVEEAVQVAAVAVAIAEATLARETNHAG